MDYAKAVTFVFDDPRWKEKIAIGTGLVLLSTFLSFVLVGILGFAILSGYSIRLMQNVRDGRQFPLPEWDEWGDDFIRGLKLWVVQIVLGLPMFLFVVPVIIGSILMEGQNAGQAIGFAVLTCGTCLMVLYGIFLWLAAPGYSIAFATDERISSGLQFTEIWHWTMANVGQIILTIIIVWLASLVVSFVAPIVGVLLLCIGWIVTIPLGVLAISIYQYHLFGQLAHEYPFGGPAVGTELAPVAPADVAVVSETAVAETPAVEEDEAAAQSDESGTEDKPA